MINFFLYCMKKMSFSAHLRVPTPHDRCPRTMTRNYFAMTPMELGGVPEKMDEHFHCGPIFYVCSSARN